LRVLIVTNMWPTEERPAFGSFVRDQVEALRRIDGLDVTVFSFIPTGGLRPYARAARALRRKHGKDEFDIVHAHYGMTAWCTLVLGGAPRVVTFHGTDLGHPTYGRLSRAVAKHMDLPATASRWLALRSLPSPEQAAVLPTGVNLARFERIDRRTARERLGLDPGGRYLLFPSDPKRPEKRYDRAQQLAEKAQATLLSYDSTPPSDVPLMINAANAVVLTSEREGFGLATLEALACDVPVLATDVGIAPLALKDVKGTLAAPFDADRWLDALRPHLDDPDPRVEGRGRAVLFDSNRMALRVFEAYRALTQGSQ
jgi:teichuronic acid biosynthesis glycosyltransferase TuaC